MYILCRLLARTLKQLYFQVRLNISRIIIVDDYIEMGRVWPS